MAADGAGRVSEGKYRTYVTSVASTAQIKNVKETRAMRIVHEVGARDIKVKRLQTMANADTMSMAVTVAQAPASDFATHAKKFSNFTADYSVMDLAAVIERLARGIAVYSATGSLDTEQLSGGTVPEMISIANVHQPLAASTGHVFLPRAIDYITSPNTFGAIVYAVAGEGSAVVTDVVELDVNGAAKLPDLIDNELATGCYNALRILGSNYSAAGAGDIFAYAVTRGIHMEMSVVGHTDEGGYMRSILRTGRFSRPYGGIDARMRQYDGLPAPSNDSLRSYIAWVDSIALVTAAAVAVSDPLVKSENGMYPTVFVTTGFTEIDNIEKRKDAMGTDQAIRIAGGCDRFVRNYITNLCRIFAMGENGGRAEAHLHAQFSNATVGTADRHLRYSVIAPFFWIEPTGLIRYDTSDMPACIEGYGHLGMPGERVAYPYAEAVEQVCVGSGVEGIRCDWRTARTNKILMHLNGHLQGGLANIRMQQADSGAWTLTGGTSSDMTTRISTGCDVGALMWVRGQSQLVAPAECIYTGGRVGMLFKQVEYDDRFTPTFTHVPFASEWLKESVVFTVGRPEYVRTGDSNWSDRVMTRQRSVATANLETHRRFGFNAGIFDMMPVSTSAPRSREIVLQRGARDMEHETKSKINIVGKRQVSSEDTEVGAVFDVVNGRKVPQTQVAGARTGPGYGAAGTVVATGVDVKELLSRAQAGETDTVPEAQ